MIAFNPVLYIFLVSPELHVTPILTSSVSPSYVTRINHEATCEIPRTVNIFPYLKIHIFKICQWRGGGIYSSVFLLFHPIILHSITYSSVLCLQTPSRQKTAFF